jgi:DNA-binding transcriptional ArsR family regulator
MMRTNSSLDALFPKTRQAILAATLTTPQRRWYMAELARHLHLTPSSLQRELASLVRAGILRQQHEGKQVYYQAATDLPIFEELRAMMLKTVGLADIIGEALRPLKKRIQWCFVYGSVARAQEHAASDVDLIIIGSVSLAELSGLLRRAEGRLARAVNPVVYTAEEFASKLRAKHHFVADVLDSTKLFVLGDPREFERAFSK